MTTFHVFGCLYMVWCDTKVTPFQINFYPGIHSFMHTSKHVLHWVFRVVNYTVNEASNFASIRDNFCLFYKITDAGKKKLF